MFASPWTLMAVAVSLFLHSAMSEMIELRGGKKFCFYDSLNKGDNWGVQFQIVDSDVAVRITSPSGVVHENQKESYGSYSLTAKDAGRHEVCFSNYEGASSPMKRVTFSLIGISRDPNIDTSKLDPAQVALQELNAGLRMVRDEQALLMEREVNHRHKAESTNSRVTWWFVMQTALLAGVCYFQINALKKFFEVRRLV